MNMYDVAVLNTELRVMNNHWNDLSIVDDVGVSEDSIVLFGKKLQAENGERPQANRYDQTEMSEKMLESIMDASAYLSETATKEYNAAPGARQFEIAAGPFAGQRDFAAICRSFHASWLIAVKAGHIPRLTPQRARTQR